MCGRYTLRTSLSKVVAEFHARLATQLPLRYNIAPNQQILVIRESEDGNSREAVPLRWGLVPRWAKDPGIGNQLINARSETVASKPAFADSFRNRRCLIPADGFYEWKRAGRDKQPHFIQMEDGRPFAFAGLWEHWEGQGEIIESCAVLTTAANDVVAPLHNRMPVILDAGDYDLWLDRAVTDPERLAPLLRSNAAQRMHATPVSPLVNSPAYDEARCIEPITPQRTLFPEM
jgi:putative SOS response-associated peptidase YedK